VIAIATPAAMNDMKFDIKKRKEKRNVREQMGGEQAN